MYNNNDHYYLKHFNIKNNYYNFDKSNKKASDI